jgi:hypothetical protein
MAPPQIVNPTYQPIPHPPTPFKSFKYVSSSAHSDPRSFYPFYLGEHTQRPNRLLHLTGSTIALAALARIISSLIPRLLNTGHGKGLFSPQISEYVARLAMSNKEIGRWFVIGLLQGYGFAWLGHFFVEKNRPASFKVSGCLNELMIVSLLFPPRRLYNVMGDCNSAEATLKRKRVQRGWAMREMCGSFGYSSIIPRDGQSDVYHCTYGCNNINDTQCAIPDSHHAQDPDRRSKKSKASPAPNGTCRSPVAASSQDASAWNSPSKLTKYQISRLRTHSYKCICSLET